MRSSGAGQDRPPRPWLASELGTRVVSALVLGVAALLATYRGGWPFALFWLVAGLAVATEWLNMARAEPRGLLRAVCAVALAVLTGAYLAGAPLVGFVAVALAGLACLLVARTPEYRAWAWPCPLYAAVIVIVPPLVRDDPDLAITGLLWMFAVVWATDIAAYFTGRRLGGPKLWPRVSPKKTWSGFAGGLLAGTAAGVLVARLAASLGWTPVASLSLVGAISAFGSVVSQLGDLAESAMKRRFDVKDSSHLIPGHGGVMDRLDGFWAVALLAGLLLAMRGA